MYSFILLKLYFIFIVGPAHSIWLSFTSHAIFAVSRASGNKYAHLGVVVSVMYSSHPHILIFTGPASYIIKLSDRKSPNLSVYKKRLFPRVVLSSILECTCTGTKTSVSVRGLGKKKYVKPPPRLEKPNHRAHDLNRVYAQVKFLYQVVELGMGRF